MKIVFDSNVLMAAFGTRGLCDALFEACGTGHQRYVSEPILAEVTRHLAAKFKMPQERAARIISYLSEQCVLVTPVDVPADACRDPDDLMVLGTGLAARAEVIVTGDHDLLSVRQFEGIAILSPRALYERLRTENA